MKSILASLLLLLVSACATAGSITVSPVQVISRGAPHVAVINFKNDADQPTRYQIEVLAWTQRGGKNIYVPSHDLLISPPMLELPAKAKRIVRVLPTRPSTGARYYVLFFRQLSSVEQVRTKGHTLNLLVNQALKASYEPANAAPAELSARVVGGHLEIANAGGSHAAVYSIGHPNEKPLEAGALGWVLPGGAFKFNVPAKAGETFVVGLADHKTVTLVAQ